MRNTQYFASLILLLASAACTASRTHTPSNTLVTAWDSAPRTIDPRFAVDANSQYLESLVHCSLFQSTPEGQFIPSLVAEYTWVSPTELKLRLKEGFKFYDGTPVTAQDVRATYLNTVDLKRKTLSPRRDSFREIESISVQGPLELTFKTKTVDAALLSNLLLGILPEKLTPIDKLEEPKEILGCGKFRITQLTPLALTLERNRAISKSNPAAIDRIEIKVVQDESTRYAKLIKGEVDLIQDDLSRDKIPLFQKDSAHFQLAFRDGLNTSYLGFNLAHPVLKDWRVRLAIGHAIDRRKLIKYVLRNSATPTQTLLLPGDPYYHPQLPSLTYDPAIAKTLLEEAGYRDSDGDGPKKRFALQYKTSLDTTRITLARAIARMLAQVGIEVTVIPMEWGRFKADVDQGNVEIWSLSWIGYKDPDILRYVFGSDNFPPEGGNRGRFSNPELDALLQKGRREIATESRKSIYLQAQEIIAKEMPYVFLWHEQAFAVFSPRLKGYVLYADGMPYSYSDIVKEGS